LLPPAKSAIGTANNKNVIVRVDFFINSSFIPGLYIAE